jgi:hypothetical protein
MVQRLGFSVQDLELKVWGLTCTALDDGAQIFLSFSGDVFYYTNASIIPVTRTHVTKFVASESKTKSFAGSGWVYSLGCRLRECAV